MPRFSWIKFKRTRFKGKESHLPPALKAPHTVHYGCSVFSKYLLMMISDICLPSHCFLMAIFKQPKLSMKISFWKGMKIPTFNILLKAFCNRPEWLRKHLSSWAPFHSEHTTNRFLLSYSKFSYLNSGWNFPWRIYCMQFSISHILLWNNLTSKQSKIGQ